MFCLTTEETGRLLGFSNASASFDELESLLFFSTDQKKFRDAFAALEKGKRELQVEFRVARPDGSASLLAMRGKLFFNFGQSRVLGVLIDVSGTSDARPTHSNRKHTPQRRVAKNRI
jgi:hypothetical protein